MVHEPRRKKDRLPKDVRELTDDEVMEKVFSKTVRKKLREEVAKADDDEGEDSNGK